MRARGKVGADRTRAKTLYLHLAMATAVFVLMEVQFIPRSTALTIGLVVAAVGVLAFGFRSRPILWLFPAAMLTTALWSSDPALTALSVTAVVTPVVLAGVVVAISDPRRFMGTLAIWTRVALIVSFGLFILRPDLGAQSDTLYNGAMQGLFAHKNGLARLLVVGVFAELFASQRMSRRIFWLALFLIAAYLTRSTSFAVLVTVIIAGAAYVRLIASRKRAVSVLTIGFTPLLVVIAGIALLLYGPEIIEESGRFSGEGDRGRIWFGALTLFGLRPLGGWGYGAVFRPETEAGELLSSFIGWIPTAAHSGYMNALAEGGWLGLIALIVTLIAGIAITWRTRSTTVWPFVWAIVVTANNLTDTRSASIEWFLLAAGVLYATQQARGARGSARMQSRGRREAAMLVGIPEPSPLARQSAPQTAPSPSPRHL